MKSLPQLPYEVGEVVLEHLEVQNPWELHRLASMALSRPNTNPLLGVVQAANADAAWRKFSPKAAQTNLYAAFRQRVGGRPAAERRQLFSLYRRLAPRRPSGASERSLLTMASEVYYTNLFFAPVKRTQISFDLTLALVSRTISPNSLVGTSSALRGEPAIAYAAVHRDGCNLRWFEGELRDERALNLVAVRQNASALAYVRGPLRYDRQIVLAAVEQNGRALGLAAPQMQDDRHIVLSAVRQDAYALHYASARLREDFEVTLTAASRLEQQWLHASHASPNGLIMWVCGQFAQSLAIRGVEDPTENEVETFCRDALLQAGQVFPPASAATCRQRLIEYVEVSGWAIPSLLR